MKKILLAEDSRIQAKLISKSITDKLDVDIIACRNYEEVKAAIAEHSSEIFLAFVALVIPGGESGEARDATLAEGIPTIIVSSSFSSELRQKNFARNIIDYVVKDSPATIDYLVKLACRIYANRFVKALVVDDSKVFREFVAKMLTDYQINVFKADSGAEALTILKKNPDISLMVTDYFMPNMDGAELIKKVRKIYKREQLSIIGLSGSGDDTLSARLIKAGANDFIHKPFQQEEFYCRISQNLDIIDQIKALTNAATKDYLTGLFNRRHFFDITDNLIANRDRGRLTLAVGMLDIDHFKSVNDTYGHDAGDKALVLVANTLQSRLRKTDVLARMGGEEFCLVVVNSEQDKIKSCFEEFRELVANIHFEVNGKTIPIRVSIGVSTNAELDINGMLMEADAMLYKAKAGGRNQVVLT